MTVRTKQHQLKLCESVVPSTGACWSSGCHFDGKMRVFEDVSVIAQIWNFDGPDLLRYAAANLEKFG